MPESSQPAPASPAANWKVILPVISVCATILLGMFGLKTWWELPEKIQTKVEAGIESKVGEEAIKKFNELKKTFGDEAEQAKKLMPEIEKTKQKADGVIADLEKKRVRYITIPAVVTVNPEQHRPKEPFETFAGSRLVSLFFPAGSASNTEIRNMDGTVMEFGGKVIDIGHVLMSGDPTKTFTTKVKNLTGTPAPDKPNTVRYSVDGTDGGGSWVIYITVGYLP